MSVLEYGCMTQYIYSVHSIVQKKKDHGTELNFSVPVSEVFSMWPACCLLYHQLGGYNLQTILYSFDV